MWHTSKFTAPKCEAEQQEENGEVQEEKGEFQEKTFTAICGSRRIHWTRKTTRIHARIWCTEDTFSSNFKWRRLVVAMYTKLSFTSMKITSYTSGLHGVNWVTPRVNETYFRVNEIPVVDQICTVHRKKIKVC